MNGIEGLESRGYLSGIVISYPYDVEQVRGRENLADEIVVTQDARRTSKVVVIVNGVGRKFARAPRLRLEILGLGGDDHIVIDRSATCVSLVDGGDGNDVIEYRASNTKARPIYAGAAVDGGAGNDRLVATGSGAGLLDGGDGNDTLTGPSTSALRGGNGDDGLAGGGVLDGGAGNDTLTGAAGSIRYDGGDGNDRVTATDAAEFITGGAGDDWIDARGGDDTIDGDVDWHDAATGRDTVFGGDGSDTVSGNAGNDWIDGGNGDDYLYGDGGADSIRGGGGRDTLAGDYEGFDSMSMYPYDMNGLPARGIDSLDGGTGDDWLAGSYHGNNADRPLEYDVMTGGAGNDVIDAREDDRITDRGAGDTVPEAERSDDTYPEYLIDSPGKRITLLFSLPDGVRGGRLSLAGLYGTVFGAGLSFYASDKTVWIQDTPGRPFTLREFFTSQGLPVDATHLGRYTMGSIRVNGKAVANVLDYAVQDGDAISVHAS